MKKLIFIACIICLFCAPGIQGKVLVVVEYGYGYNSTNWAYVSQYLNDLSTIDFKKYDLQYYWNNTSPNTYDQCHPLWQIIHDEYQNSYDPSNPDNCLEGVVLVGNLPKAWTDDDQIVPDDRYFMQICNDNHTCYSSDTPNVWHFDQIRNLFTNYQNPDYNLDIWVSRIMADPIRGLRDGPTDVMDEYTILNNYFTRLHERMTQPAKVPPRGFVMGGITGWTDHNPVTKFDFTDLNLRSVFSFDYPDNRPANWLLQLIWGPHGGTTLGAFNGTRYEDIGTNNITMTYPLLHNFKNGVDTSIGASDTLGYEWAGINEHSTFQCHNFNQAPDEITTPYGIFWDVIQGKQWNYVWNTFDLSYYNNYAYVYNPLYDPNPYNAICGKQQHAFFKILAPSSGTYHIYMHYPLNSSNCPYVYGFVHSWPSNNDFSSESDLTWTFGTIGPPLISVNQTTHIHTDGAPNSNWEEIGADTTGIGYPGVCNGFNCRANDSIWVMLQNDGANLIADAVKFVGPGGTIVVDNLDPGFASDNWYDRGFLDMQDEDPVYHAAYSKVPFFVSSGCEVGNYMKCYNYDSVYQNLTSVIANDLGLLYGMAHSGLISLTSAISYPGHQGSPFTPFTTTLAGKDSHGLPNTFGDGVLNQSNANLLIPYVFIGAGTLRADSSAYVPYGTKEAQLIGQQISGTFSHSYPDSLVWLQNFTVTATGNCTITAKEIRIYAESDLQGTVDIIAQ